MIRSLCFLLLISLVPDLVLAATHYVRQGAIGANNGNNWTDAWTTLPATLTRGDTYYIADGNYPSYDFDDPESGNSIITIKKATIADHGTDTGWVSTYGDGQAILGSAMTFKEGYYTVDGNGTHRIPSNNTNDYGFKISADTDAAAACIVRIGTSGFVVSNIIMKYVHVYNTLDGSVWNNTVGIRFYSSGANNYVKLQNCFFENSGKDGIQLNTAEYVLIERSYIKRYGRKESGNPDTHGQAIQAFTGVKNIIIRWNIFEANEGQSLWAIANNIHSSNDLRFYGNVVFTGYGQSNTAGFNVGGGIIGNVWNGTAANPDLDGLFIYNNTIVNINEVQTTHNPIGSHFTASGGPSDYQKTNIYGHNNLFFNSKNAYFGGADAYSYNASGVGAAGVGTAGGTNEQTGLSSTIFTNYTGNNFTLASATNAGLDLTSQGWWLGGADGFFGTVDSNLDLYGNTRGSDGTWDRGAFEFLSDVVVPNAPTGLSVQ